MCSCIQTILFGRRHELLPPSLVNCNKKNRDLLWQNIHSFGNFYPPFGWPNDNGQANSIPIHCWYNFDQRKTDINALTIPYRCIGTVSPNVPRFLYIEKKKNAEKRTSSAHYLEWICGTIRTCTRSKSFSLFHMVIASALGVAFTFCAINKRLLYHSMA